MVARVHALREAEARHSDVASRRRRVLATVLVSADGDYIEAHQRKPALARGTRGKRGIISGFSRSSRRRLWSIIMRLDRARLPLFVTLTFHRVWPEDVSLLKRMLDTLFKRLRRRYPQASALWKLEYQRRGAPHFHLLMWGFPLADRDWLAHSWAEIVAHYTGDDVEILRGWHLGRLGRGNQHCVQRVRSWRGVISYAAKYLAKEERCVSAEGEVLHTGRIWGVHNRNFIPWSYILVYIAGASFRRYRRVVRALAERRGLVLPALRRDAGFRVFAMGASLRALMDWSKIIVDFRLDNSFLSCYNACVS